MKNYLTRKNIAVFAFLAVLFGWSANMLGYIYYGTSHIIIEPALALLFVALLLCFCRNEIFHSWLKLIAWWLPIGGGISIADSSVSGAWTFFPIRIFAITIVSASLFLFVIKTWELRRVDRGNPVSLWLKWGMLVTAFVGSILLSFEVYRIF